MVNNYYINLMITVIGLIISVIGLVQTLISSKLNSKTRRWSIHIYVVLFSYILCSLIAVVFSAYKGKQYVLPHSLFLLFESLISSLLMPMMTAYILSCRGESKSNILKRPEMIVSEAIFFVHVCQCIITLFTTEIYYINSENAMVRGPLYFVKYAEPVLLMIWNMIVLIKSSNRLSKKQRIAFWLVLIFPTISLLAITVFPNISFIILGTSFSAFFLNTYILMDQTEKFYKKDAENSELKINILLAQIKPHFLYNSLTVIKYLCKKDPEKAEKAIGDFASYLRHNMDSLGSDKPIWFSEELKHVKEYTSLQQLRFDDELNITYDLKFTDFMIPTLTLQPVIENAITYGARQNDKDKGEVVISSVARDGKVYLSVEDNGPGFDYKKAVEKDTGRSHLGINNVKERLKNISGGDLIIESEIGKGTKVTIVLPYIFK